MRRLAIMAFAGGLLLAGLPLARPAHAQNDGTAVEKLLQILVKNGVVTHQQADELGRQAKAEARSGRIVPTAPSGGFSPAAVPPLPGATDKPVVPGSVRVTYVPETVRKQIAAEVKQSVMQQATEEGWAAPNVIPGWTQRIKITGDLRIRGQFDFFPSGNYNAFPDFNGINTSANGFDALSGLNPPLLNTTQDRTRMRLRARIGLEAKVTDYAGVEIRLATGNDRSPVSSNQTLGTPGDFQKYQVFIDRANLTIRPEEHTTLYAGRFANPFWTTDLMYDDDLSFDGIAASGRTQVSRDFGAFATFGGFPVFNTDFNLGSTNLIKTKSHDSYLVAGQVGSDWRPADEDYSGRIAVGFFAYENIQGKTSTPCVAPTGYGSCSTDDTRVPFLQFGNSLIPIRNISAVNGAATAQPQYYGLASGFGVLDLHGQITYSGFHPVDIIPEAEFSHNLNFDKAALIRRGPVNNLGSGGDFIGSNTAYLGRVTVGHPVLERGNDWNVALTYKYIGSDAVLDALNDSRFHLGGTNAKGFVVGGNYALDKNFWLSGNYYSTQQVAGPPLAIDSLLLELNAKF